MVRLIFVAGLSGMAILLVLGLATALLLNKATKDLEKEIPTVPADTFADEVQLYVLRMGRFYKVEGIWTARGGIWIRVYQHGEIPT